MLEVNLSLNRFITHWERKRMRYTANLREGCVPGAAVETNPCPLPLRGTSAAKGNGIPWLSSWPPRAHAASNKKYSVTLCQIHFKSYIYLHSWTFALPCDIFINNGLLWRLSLLLWTIDSVKGDCGSVFSMGASHSSRQGRYLFESSAATAEWPKTIDLTPYHWNCIN